MDIIYLLKVLWRKKWIIIGVTILSVVAAFLFTKTMPRQYKSVSQIATGFTTDEAITVTDNRVGPREMELNFSNLLASMNSGLVLNFLSYRMILHDLDNPTAAFRSVSIESKFNPTDSSVNLVRKLFKEKLTNQTGLSIDMEHSELMVSFLNAYRYDYNSLKGSIAINRVLNTDFIEVELTSENPNLSAYAVNSFCEEFLLYYAKTRFQRSGESVNFFEQLVTQKKTELDEKSETLRLFKSTNSFLNIEVEGESKLSQIADLEKDRDMISSVIYGLRLTIDKLRNDQKKGGTSNSSANENILRLRQQINSINDRYISSGSKNQVLLDSLNYLRDRLKSEMSSVSFSDGEGSKTSKSDVAGKLSDAEIQLAIEESKLNSVNNKIRNLQYSITGFASKEGTSNALTREVEVATTEYLDAVNRFNEAKNKLLVSAGAIRQLNRATPSSVPISSKKIVIMGMAGFTTFCLAVFIIVLFEVIDMSIKTPGQFERTIKIRLLGSMIKVNTKKINYSTLFAKKTGDEELEMFKHYIRKIRFEIDQLNVKTILFTSPRSESGKTFILFSVAYSLSLVDKKVLIIDTNFKNNSLTKWLTKQPTKDQLIERWNNDSGIKLLTSTEESTKQNEEEPIQSLILPTKYNGISIIGNAGGLDSPEEIFSGRDFVTLMASLVNEFDYIFLEGASLNEYSDSKELVRYVDCVVPIFSADDTLNSIDRESIRYLKGLKKKLGGAILNSIDRKDLR
jgi:polysaccharide biosynthesis transport protein